jgi:hypothetical protein
VASSKRSANNTVDKYLSPNEGIITTIFFPAKVSRMLNSKAALTAAPDEIPQRIP